MLDQPDSTRYVLSARQTSSHQKPTVEWFRTKVHGSRTGQFHAPPVWLYIPELNSEIRVRRVDCVALFLSGWLITYRVACCI